MTGACARSVWCSILLNAGQTEVEFDLTHHADHGPAGWETLVDTLRAPDNGGLVYPSRVPVVVSDRTLLLLREMPPVTKAD